MSEAWSTKLKGLARERRQALAKARSCEKKMAREAGRARDAGRTVQEIADALGYSRQHAHKILKRGKG